MMSVSTREIVTCTYIKDLAGVKLCEKTLFIFQAVWHCFAFDIIPIVIWIILKVKSMCIVKQLIFTSDHFCECHMEDIFAKINCWERLIFPCTKTRDMTKPLTVLSPCN